ncbi:MAG: hypothetical protein AAGK78_03425 [Planctomycetota bacterium]
MTVDLSRRWTVAALAILVVWAVLVISLAAPVLRFYNAFFNHRVEATWLDHLVHVSGPGIADDRLFAIDVDTEREVAFVGNRDQRGKSVRESVILRAQLVVSWRGNVGEVVTDKRVQFATLRELESHDLEPWIRRALDSSSPELACQIIPPLHQLIVDLANGRPLATEPVTTTTGHRVAVARSSSSSLRSTSQLEWIEAAMPLALVWMCGAVMIARPPGSV